jgi:hypothetical protein
MRLSSHSTFCILCMMLLVCVMPVQATTWVFLRGVDKSSRHAYDRDRLRIEGTAVIFWRQVKFSKPQSSEFGEVSRAIYHERLECQSQMLQTFFVGLYNSDHQKLMEQRMPEPVASTLILPESIGELFQTALCRLVSQANMGTDLSKKSGAVSSKGAGAFVPQRRPVTEVPSVNPAPIMPIAPIAPAPLSLPSVPIVPPIMPPLMPTFEP